LAFTIHDLDQAHAADALDFCVAAGTPHGGVPAQRADSERWLGDVLREWNPCGKLGYVEGKMDGMLLYLPGEIASGRSLCAHFADNPVEYPAVWREDGVIVIICLWVKAEGRGLGSALLERLFEEMRRGREFRGVPRRTVGVMVYHPSDQVHWPAGPVEYYRRLGFRIEHLDAAGKRAWLSRALMLAAAA
jgi:GNAT superfamily N-acetyltransferase